MNWTRADKCYLWALYIKLEAHQECSFKTFYRTNKSLTNDEVRMLIRCYKPR